MWVERPERHGKDSTIPLRFLTGPPTGRYSREYPQVDGHVLSLSARHAKFRPDGYRKTRAGVGPDRLPELRTFRRLWRRGGGLGVFSVTPAPPAAGMRGGEHGEEPWTPRPLSVLSQCTQLDVLGEEVRRWKGMWVV